MKRTAQVLVFFLAMAAGWPLYAQKTIVVRPKEINDVLVNPGIGFMTFQRFNGDKLNPILKGSERNLIDYQLSTGGNPIQYQQSKTTGPAKNSPMTSIAYYRIYWRFLEPQKGKYRWDLIDKALDTAHTHGQTLILRVAPYGTNKNDYGTKKGNNDVNDVPDWYRALVGPEPVNKRKESRWRTDPENPLYAESFGRFIRALGARYDGHPDLESVDLSIVGPWGEGAGSALLTEPTREALVDAYLDGFHQTPLLMMLTDRKTNTYGLSKWNVGWRVDCLGDLFGVIPTWCHMLDYYPESIINFGMKDAWKKAPVSFEACWVMQFWKNKNWDINYIIDQSLKWHISSFNAKSSPVPPEWWPAVNRWLKRMGYRFVLRKFTYPDQVTPNGKLAFTSWWENKGVAPCYRKFPVALRLKNEAKSIVLKTGADIRSWLPGDAVYDDAVFVPFGTPPGSYDLDIALLDPYTEKPKVKLAIAGATPDGWYRLGRIKVVPRSYQ